MPAVPGVLACCTPMCTPGRTPITRGNAHGIRVGCRSGATSAPCSSAQPVAAEEKIGVTPRVWEDVLPSLREKLAHAPRPLSRSRRRRLLAAAVVLTAAALSASEQVVKEGGTYRIALPLGGVDSMDPALYQRVGL